MDQNDCIFPVAFAVVEVEDTNTWKWFLSTLKENLSIVNTSSWTIMSDKQKGLINVVDVFFPDSEHRFCVRHMYQNFREKFKGEVLKQQLWKCARSTQVVQWQEAMEKMRVLNSEEHAWLEELDPKTWARAFQSDLPKCDILLNNNCEVFNKYILEARELPMVSMIEKVKQQLTLMNYNKRKEEVNWETGLCPKIMKKLSKNVEFSALCEVVPSDVGLFDVEYRGRHYMVSLKDQSCACRRWDMSGIPCCHAIACLRHENILPEDRVHPCYSIAKFRQAYSYVIYPCRDRTEWPKVNGRQVLPPKYEKKVGSPPKNRRKQPEEKEGPNGKKVMSRHGRIMHCSHCGGSNHNRGGCYYYKNGIDPKMKEGTRIGVQQPVQNVQQTVQFEYDPVITQDHNIFQPTTMLDDSVIATLIHESQIQQSQTMPPQDPLPECDFIASQVDLTRQRPMPPSQAQVA